MIEVFNSQNELDDSVTGIFFETENCNNEFMINLFYQQLFVGDEILQGDAYYISAYSSYLDLFHCISFCDKYYENCKNKELFEKYKCLSFREKNINFLWTIDLTAINYCILDHKNVSFKKNNVIFIDDINYYAKYYNESVEEVLYEMKKLSLVAKSHIIVGMKKPNSDDYMKYSKFMNQMINVRLMQKQIDEKDNGCMFVYKLMYKKHSILDCSCYYVVSSKNNLQDFGVILNFNY